MDTVRLDDMVLVLSSGGNSLLTALFSMMNRFFEGAAEPTTMYGMFCILNSVG